jgi:hypothetical protein
MSQIEPTEGPAGVLARLGLFEKITNVPKLDAGAMDRFDRRELAFDWVNMGTTDLPIARLFDVLRETPVLSPPRTGHLGNWSDIARGRSGILDYNRVICGSRQLGYPLVYDLNQTEGDARHDGDWLYLPGSIVDRGVRTPLRLFTRDGGGFAERTRDHPLFCPFVLTPRDGQLVPLTRVHREAGQGLTTFRFTYASSFLRSHTGLIQAIFHELLEEARTRPDAPRAIEDIFDRVVTLDGRVTRTPILPKGRGYLAGETPYADTDALIDAAFLPLQAAEEPDAFFARVDDVPRQLPLLSVLMVNMLYALLSTHYPGGITDREAMTRPCNPHIHWGALGMAGYPPRRRGYFREKVKNARDLCTSIVRHFPEIDPVFYILLPSSIFALWPAAGRWRDVDLVEGLIREVHAQTDPLVGKPNLMSGAIDRVVETWLGRSSGELSPDFMRRLTPGRLMAEDLDSPDSAEPIEPSEFSDLTFGQASMMVGALLDLASQMGRLA